MTPQQAAEACGRGAVVLDMRLPRPFAKEHIAGAINLQFNRADLVDRAELVLPREQQYIVHAEPEPLARIAVELLRGAGFEVLGWIEGGLAGWKAAGLPSDTIPVIDVDELKSAAGRLTTIDARDPFEYKHGHVPGASLLSWTEASRRARDAPREALAVICGDEVRSSLVASFLRREGRDVRLVTGGMVDWSERNYPVEKGMPA